MNSPQSWSSREEALLLINAYIDNELDAASALEVEERLRSDTSLQAEFERLSALRTVIARNVRKPQSADALRQRIADLLPAAEAEPPAVVTPMTRPSKPPRHYAWRQMAAAAAIAACLTGGILALAPHRRGEAEQMAEIVSGHQRALLATAPFDVASSDRHTVKPWFDAKVALSPQVLDLSDAGFPLVGGRVDIIDGSPAPVSVYKRRQHVISLIAVPRIGSRDDGRAATGVTRNGYGVVSWPGRDFEYRAVSDIAEPELHEFVDDWRAAARKELTQ